MKRQKGIPFKNNLELRAMKIKAKLQVKGEMSFDALWSSDTIHEYQLLSTLKDLEERGEILRRDENGVSYWRIKNNV